MSEQQRKKLESETMALQKLQKEYSTLVASRQKLDSQLQENTLVSNEFKLLDDGARVYKMIGPVLVPQDKAEASANVEKRLEYITEELGRIEKRITQQAKEQEEKSVSIFKLQMDIQGISKA
ncbi:Prefoldin subunit 6 [Coemansia sp. RSA 2675]|uniref:Prefoldin subunit 6 n=2 Tax=Coemansia TaxID=4863 RepID=A0A9W8GM15_9FUNG|nr:Prefoldin subunit 6 [Coemansia sp. RSA 2675]KAJ2023384.1 Prefoldin subunit 6 [Coemansia sp. S85]KAJ2687144.1 Prefoldin subunit 6 [Coemansia spiralis]KAJ2699347.1 Prefoldin subunit 6 [Coemansia sp. IMI 209128]KAJ2768037.1 Prefoldin subunit 6 [Coemansia linderi]